ncbi:hypothetical protein KJ359_012346 [Pestalotiopsis sp. 9143b]|nr:hypothetical protein KJ359_012346 [Pestalotiopsis sp. 9143b]
MSSLAAKKSAHSGSIPAEDARSASEKGLAMSAASDSHTALHAITHASGTAASATQVPSTSSAHSTPLNAGQPSKKGPTKLSHRAIPPKLRGPGRPDSPANESLPRPSADLSAKQVPLHPEHLRDKRKPASFLSRLSMIGNKKRMDDMSDNASEISDMRTEGANAVAFSSDIDFNGYIPRHKEPPRYIRVRTHHKKTKEFNRMFLAQELVGTEAPHDDATENAAINGRDRVVRVWAVIATQEDRKAYEEESVGANASAAERLSAPVFRPRPIREFSGHTGEILDLSWSKNNFLLSSSMDKTVRLWHLSRDECLCTFKHKDFVTSIAFHPRDDRFFLAGSLDSILRLWSIPDKSVAYSSQIADLVTAVAFSPDGKTSIAGCLNGLCTFYETEGLKFETQMHVRSSRGKNAKGSKITGIQTMTSPPDEPDGEVKVLVTSNDSRVRIYNLRDKALELKFKGHENTSNQIRASFSDDGNYVICGSEDKQAFIWSTGPSQSDNKEKRPTEHFEANSAIITQAIFAPAATRQLLQASHDPLFTLCNPPPVTLMSREEANMSQTTLGLESVPDKTLAIKKPVETPAFIARSKHHDGNVVVTTDHAGIIKVFRQDCAFAKRRHDSWEAGSTFSRRVGKDGLLGRSGSVKTSTSAGTREPASRRGSISQAPPSGLGPGTPQFSSERIMSWRQGVEGTPSRPNSIALATPARSERSMSPAKSRTPIAPTAHNAASEARRQPYASSLASPPLQPTSPTSSVKTNDQDRLAMLDRPPQPPPPSFTFKSVDEEEEDKDPGLHVDPTGASYSFWNLNRWRGKGNNGKSGTGNGPGSVSPDRGRKSTEAGAATTLSPVPESDGRRKSLGSRVIQPHSTSPDKTEYSGRRKSVPCKDGLLTPPGGRPNYDRQASVVSTLTSEEISNPDVSDDGDRAQCSKCGSGEFKSKKVAGQQRLVCSQCGRIRDN